MVTLYGDAHSKAYRYVCKLNFRSVWQDIQSESERYLQKHLKVAFQKEILLREGVHTQHGCVDLRDMLCWI